MASTPSLEATALNIAKHAEYLAANPDTASPVNAAHQTALYDLVLANPKAAELAIQHYNEHAAQSKQSKQQSNADAAAIKIIQGPLDHITKRAHDTEKMDFTQLAATHLADAAQWAIRGYESRSAEDADYKKLRNVIV